MHLTATIKPVPVPIIVHKIILVWALRARPLPHFPAFFTEPIGHFNKLTLTDTSPTSAIVAARKRWLPNLTGLHPLDALNNTRLAAALITHLHFLFILPRCGHDQFALPRILTGRFLNINVLTCLHSENSHRGVPKIGRSDGHCIDRFII